MKKIVIKVLLIVIIMNFAILLSSDTVKASFWGDVTSSGDKFLEAGKSNASGVSDTETKEIVNVLYNTLLTLGTIVIIAVGGIMGIKFMMASAEEKAKIKEALVPYIAGSIVIFGAFGIWKMFITIFSKV